MDLSSVDVNEKLVKDCADELQVVFDSCRIVVLDGVFVNFELGGFVFFSNLLNNLKQGKLDQLMVCYSDISTLSVDDLGNIMLRMSIYISTNT